MGNGPWPMVLRLRVAASLGGQTTGMSDGQLFPVNRRRRVRMKKRRVMMQEVEQRKEDKFERKAEAEAIVCEYAHHLGPRVKKKKKIKIK